MYMITYKHTHTLSNIYTVKWTHTHTHIQLLYIQEKYNCFLKEKTLYENVKRIDSLDVPFTYCHQFNTSITAI